MTGKLNEVKREHGRGKNTEGVGGGGGGVEMMEIQWAFVEYLIHV